MSPAIHSGNVRLDQPGRFRDMVNGTLTIGAGCDVEMAGMVNGTLIVEPGAIVRVSGMINGGIIDQGGRVTVTGMVCD